LFLLLSFFALSAVSYSQRALTASDTALLESLYQNMRAYESQFYCGEKDSITGNNVKARVVGDPAFDSLYNLASSRILTSSQDLIRNGKAAALDFNESLKRLTINYTWKENGTSRMWNAGFIAEESSKKLFELFGKKGWKEGFSFNFGVAVPICARTILFLSKDCDTLRELRSKQYLVLLRNYAKVLATDRCQIDDIRKRIQALHNFNLNMLLSNTSTYKATPETVTDAELKLLASWDMLRSANTDSLTLLNIYRKEIADFEVTMFDKAGYRLHWFNFNVSGGLKRFTIYDTAVVRLASIDKKNLPRFTVTGSYSLFQEAARNDIFYFSFETVVGNTNYLEEIQPLEIMQLKSGSAPDIVKEDYEALVVKDYDKLKKGYAFIAPGFVINYFPGAIGKFKRFLGIEIGGSTRYKVFVPDGVNARNVFSCRGGLLFTFERDKVAKTTFGVIASLTDIPFKDVTVKDRFGVNIRIGVPFNY